MFLLPYTVQKLMFSIKDLVTFTEEIPNGQLYFLCCAGGSCRHSKVILKKDNNCTLRINCKIYCKNNYWFKLYIFKRLQNITHRHVYDAYTVRIYLSDSVNLPSTLGSLVEIKINANDISLCWKHVDFKLEKLTILGSKLKETQLNKCIWF